MPPASHTLIHPSARPPEGERATLLAAMRRMLGDSPPLHGDDESEGG